ncbi:SpoIIAA family protein [Flavobacterium selenitireducens]|uniref:STAS/SEC14 domain-containing protein n=1 Tax=Flavobacterium selenitireducens TaxID=2722704 RepID=UPI00168AFDD8|nr:STAS/SEC14 domain-containing protein [Flavobacterium selenitireducens]MBD3583347.1 STAS/SEC14 domain-containing protein [Flavobacterium selenitireducens]
MIQKINEVPANMVAFRASGEVTKEDFENVFPEVEALVERTGKLNYLLELETSPSNFTMGAWLQDALLGIKNITKWNRAAIVSDSDAVRTFTDAFSKVMPGEFRGFPKEEFDHAVDWVSEKTI